MGSKQQTADFIVDQLSPVGQITAKKMFGEFGLYCDDIFFGLICDDRLFVKPTEAGRQFIGQPTDGIPYPNARPHFLLDDKIDNGPWLCDAIRATIQELASLKKPKRKK
ncbi:MAG: TfoX/Sxy family protein [Planctomycetaceae bacterium]|nr:TfoX/Sxy family protein [Planctomycetaceae bacterium]